MSGILRGIERYYTDKLRHHGPTPRGVDWNSAESQALRFEQLMKVVDGRQPFSINDYGCGYGALVDYMTARPLEFQYCGFDISREMASTAERLHSAVPRCEFVSSESLLEPADYTVASGPFNVKLETSVEEWTAYVVATLWTMNRLSRKGFAFNILTKYSDPELMQPALYYADPCFYFDYCKQNFSRHVALLHDYGLFEFTILLKR